MGPSEGVRPLGDRLKQTLFAILEPELRGRSFLDLFAGTGSGGIEALSRGAASATFVESDADAIGAIGRNLAAAHLAGPSAAVVRADVPAWLERRAGERLTTAGFAAVLVDAPYDQATVLLGALETLAAAGPGGIVAPDGVVVAKHPARSALPSGIGLLRSSRQRRVGESALTFYRWSDREAG